MASPHWIFLCDLPNTTMQKVQHDSEKPFRSKDPMRSKEELPQTLIGFQPTLNTPGSWKSMAKAYGIN
jgi:hypothetical protein